MTLSLCVTLSVYVCVCYTQKENVFSNCVTVTMKVCLLLSTGVHLNWPMLHLWQRLLIYKPLGLCVRATASSEPVWNSQKDWNAIAQHRSNLYGSEGSHQEGILTLHRWNSLECSVYVSDTFGCINPECQPLKIMITVFNFLQETWNSFMLHKTGQKVRMRTTLGH